MQSITFYPKFLMVGHKVSKIPKKVFVFVFVLRIELVWWKQYCFLKRCNIIIVLLCQIA